MLMLIITPHPISVLEKTDVKMPGEGPCYWAGMRRRSCSIWLSNNSFRILAPECRLHSQERQAKPLTGAVLAISFLNRLHWYIWWVAALSFFLDPFLSMFLLMVAFRWPGELVQYFSGTSKSTQGITAPDGGHAHLVFSPTSSSSFAYYILVFRCSHSAKDSIHSTLLISSLIACLPILSLLTWSTTSISS